MITEKFDDLVRELRAAWPSEQSVEGLIFYFKDRPVRLIQGEMEGVHWVDIQIELVGFRAESLGAAQKVLIANREMGAGTPIPTWFGLNENTQNIMFINRLDWRYVNSKIMEEHILRCIDQMSDALQAEGV